MLLAAVPIRDAYIMRAVDERSQTAERVASATDDRERLRAGRLDEGSAAELEGLETDIRNRARQKDERPRERSLATGTEDGRAERPTC